MQKKLQQLGHETIVLQREFYRHYSLKEGVKHYARQFVKLLVGRKPMWHYYVAQEKRDYIARYTTPFIENHISPLSKKCYFTEQLIEEFNSLQLDAVIVGSDQVWRPDYSPCQSNYFLDFLPSESKIRKISYAASFGTDKWLFTPEETKKYGDLLKLFDAVSVRELSGIDLCKEHFGVDAVQVVDPTMLLDKEDYIHLVPTTKQRGNLFCYMLNRNQEKTNVINEIAHRTFLQPFENMPLLEFSPDNLYRDIESCVAPPVEDWLSAFMEADMVVTDSFHGCVFSIIFNKPFWVIGNKERGLARFDSLLRQFDLQERLISPADIENLDVYKPIDWERVNQRRNELKKEAIDFIESSLEVE